MRRALGVVSAIFLSIFVSGCAVPVGVTVASWAIDGVSYMATNKSLTDHGISFMAGQDCALHRIVTEMDLYAVCQEYNDPESKVTAIADASEIIEKQLRKDKVDDIFHGFDVRQPASRGLAPRAMNIHYDRVEIAKADLSIEEIANFETAAGGSDQTGDSDQSDFEKFEDPAERKSSPISRIWNFLVDITS